MSSRSAASATDPFEAARRALIPEPVDCEVVIVGAGFGGLGAAIECTRLGIEDFVILERDTGVGGTWHANTYPGVAVDIASPTYSYSFAPNPDWSRLYAPGAELKRYADHIADTYGLRERIRFGTTVTEARWDEVGQFWTLTLGEGPALTARIVVVATGILSQPKDPQIPGLDDFAGTVIHTSRWPRSTDLSGKRVAFIGTGATAVQAIPEVAKIAAQVGVYQRTPIWVTPKPDLPIAPVVRRLFRAAPATQRALRYTNAVAIEYVGAGLFYFRRAPWIVGSLETACKAHLRLQVRDRAVRAALTPDYNFFCKRPTFSNTYFPAFNRDNVELVTTAIDHIHTRGIVTDDARDREFDAIVLATGFILQDEGNVPAFPIYGRGGVEQGAHWRAEGYESYEGITVTGYPNMFGMNNPFSFTGLSFFYQAESQMGHIGRVITEMRRRQAVVFEVKPHAQRRFVDRMDRNARGTVWAAGNCATANSYYFNAAGQTRLGYLDPTLVAQWRNKRFPLSDYRFDTVTDPVVRAAHRTESTSGA
ncbi:flavin-containing monooxygenase [Nocardia terpenica]|uniref:NAD(P)-binding protein n=1 Tax=Nocardia terpenica TaxID=455432 RepID=A0A6G9Z7J1_9NOCA|nr:NAD(P)/FAD-dependent oxidoreductase [Nocardia terpenica]QIS21414.1 NAD(P)-binding protein [Nocardia terpenica]